MIQWLVPENLILKASASLRNKRCETTLEVQLVVQVKNVALHFTLHFLSCLKLLKINSEGKNTLEKNDEN